MHSITLLLSFGVTGTLAGWRDPPHFKDGRDLEHFITRPELKAPRYLVSKHHPDAITDGYWFIPPYTSLDGQPPTGRKEHTPCQTGPHIYDGEGSLVWSGACNYENQNTFAFKPVEINRTQHLKFSLTGWDLPDDVKIEDRMQSGIVMNSNYKEVSRLYARGKGKWLDAHEFNILPGGKSMLFCTNWIEKGRDASMISEGKRNIFDGGFQEIDLQTGNILFDWEPVAHGVLMNESFDAAGMDPLSKGLDWDYFHINSVDKDEHGDYLISGRHTSTIYKISGKDGHVIWRLGGYNSDFKMENGLTFHWQHHVCFRSKNSTHSIISLFDNGLEDFKRDTDVPEASSSGKIILLHTATRTPTAKILRQFDRPDGGKSPKLGNVQMLGDDVETASASIGWGLQGYLSEHDSTGRVVLEAKFMSDRVNSSRAYKASFVGNPTEPPAFKVIPMAYSKDETASALYVSWNGATEVVSWAFYGGETENGIFFQLATVRKTGFETSWVMPGTVQYAYAEALDINGTALSRSWTTKTAPSSKEAFDNTADIPNQTEPTQSTTSATLSVHRLKSAIPKWQGLEPIKHLIVLAFAIFGLYCAARKLIGTGAACRRRRVYKSLSGSEKDFS